MRENLILYLVPVFIMVGVVIGAFFGWLIGSVVVNQFDNHHRTITEQDVAGNQTIDIPVHIVHLDDEDQTIHIATASKGQVIVFVS